MHISMKNQGYRDEVKFKSAEPLIWAHYDDTLRSQTVIVNEIINKIEGYVVADIRAINGQGQWEGDCIVSSKSFQITSTYYCHIISFKIVFSAYQL